MSNIVIMCIQADTMLGAFAEYFMFDNGWLFITQLIALSIPLLYVAIVRPFTDWLKNVSSAVVYCTSILAIVAAELPSNAQLPLGFVIVFLMALFCIGLFSITIGRLVISRRRKRRRKQEKYVTVLISIHSTTLDL